MFSLRFCQQKISPKKIAIILFALASAACGTIAEEKDETKNMTPHQIYKQAKDEMDSGSYSKAAKLFEKLEARYPFGQFAQQSQLDMAYAYYKAKENESALAACDRFIRLHPNHAAIDYAYYLKGLVNFNEDLGISGYITQQDLTERDQKAARQAFEAFKELVTRFPNSKFVPDATKRMTYLINALANNEVHVARYYFKRGAYLAAINRAQTMITQYPNSPAHEEALVIMIASYDKLKMTDLRDDTTRILKLNFPNTKIEAGQNPGPKDPWWKWW